MAGPRARRGHRPARRRRHRGHAAVQPRGVRLGRQPEVVQHRRPQDQLARRQRRRDDAVLRLRDVRGIQHADGLGHRRERRQRRLHEHGHEVGRQPLHERPQLLLHERRAAGRQRRRRPARARSACSRAAGQTGAAGNPVDISLRLELDARRPDQARQGRGSSARSAAGGSISCRSARATPTARRPSTTTDIRNFMGKATWQTTASMRTSFMFNRNIKNRYPPPRRAVPVRRGQGDGAAGPAGAELRRPVQPRARPEHGDRRAASAACGACFPSRYQSEVRPTDIALRDVQTNSALQRRRDPVAQPELPRARPTARSATSSRTSRGGTPRPQGRPAAVVGEDGVRAHPQRRHPARDARTACRSRGRSPTRRSTRTTGSRPGARSSRTAGRWAAPPSTSALRIDGVSGYLPAQASPAGTYVGERAFPKTDVFDSRSTSRRGSASPTTCSATARPR